MDSRDNASRKERGNPHHDEGNPLHGENLVKSRVRITAAR
jgi:hypothetical protein